jgi:hypothetical protein
LDSTKGVDVQISDFKCADETALILSAAASVPGLWPAFKATAMPI